MIVDLFLVYHFIKRLATPFTEWKAYDLGIIDERGNILKKTRDLRTVEERKSWGKFDVMISKLKRLLEKVPGGQTRIASYAAALYLIKESQAINSHDQEELTEEELLENFDRHFDYVKENFHLIEEVPVNSAGGGAVAGIGVGPKEKAEPGFSPEQMRRYKKKKQILSRLKR
jgi:hypothetical protein